MDPIVPTLEKHTRRRRKLRIFRHSRVPVRMMVPNFFTLLGLCAGLTSIRLSIEGRYELALFAIVFAALLDGIDGRIARLLKASSRFGAELDSLADFVNFGVAPAIMLFTWGAGEQKSLGWIAVMLFALASALRLARFNASLDEERPRWQANYFQGIPTPAAAILVLLPIYLVHLDFDLRASPITLNLVLAYTVGIGILMITTIPTFSGKLMGERIGREWVLPLLVLAVAGVACLVTYPFPTLMLASILYLAAIPLSWRSFKRLERANAPAPPAEAAASRPAHPQGDSRIIEIRPLDKKG